MSIEDGCWIVRDRQSGNGVFVNGTRVDHQQMLSRADVIGVGSEDFRFYADVRSTPPVSRVAQLEVTTAGMPTVPKSTASVPVARSSKAVKAAPPVARPSAATRVASPFAEFSTAVTVEAPVPRRAMVDEDPDEALDEDPDEPVRPGFLAWVWAFVALAVVAAVPFFLLNR